MTHSHARELPSWLALGSAQGLLALCLSQYLPMDRAVWVLLALTPCLLVAPLCVEQAFAKLQGLFAGLNWSHALWLLLFLSGLVFRSRGVDSIREQPLDAWAIYRVALVGLSFLLLAGWLFRADVAPRFLLRGIIAPLAVYSLVCVASSLWSAQPAWTFYKSIEYLTEVSVLAMLMWTATSTRTYKVLLDFTWTLYAALLGTVWIGVLIWPHLAIRREHGVGILGFALNGVFPAVGWNTVGEISALVSIVCLTRLLFRPGGRARGTIYGVAAAAGLLTLLLSSSRSSIAGLLLGFAAVLFAARRTRALLALATLALLIGSQTSAGDLAQRYFMRGQDDQAFYSLSGRVPLWEHGLAQLSDRPLTGFGAYAGGRFVTLAGFNADTRAGSSTVLNTYLEVLLGTSFWGLIPLLAACLWTWRVLLRAARQTGANRLLESQLALEAIGVLGVLTTRSWFTVKFVWHPALLFLAVVGCAEFLRQKSLEPHHP